MTRIIQVLDPKDLAENDVVTFDFSGMTEVGETLDSTPSVVCEVYTGTDPSPSSVLSGLPQVAGLTVLQKITGGVLGAQYHLRCVSTFSPTNRILALACVIPVIRL